MAALASSMRLGTSAFTGSPLAARPAAARPQPFTAAVMPVRAAQTLSGKVVSVKCDKTAMVAVSRLSIHPVYKKRTKITTKFAAHDETNECQVGDLVVLAACRPISKSKRFVVESIVKKAEP